MEANRDLRGETELRLLATAVMSDSIEVRTKILSDTKLLTTDSGKTMSAKLRETYKNMPNIDSGAFLLSLSLEEQRLMVLAMETNMSSAIAERRVDDTIKQLRQLNQSDELKKRLSEIVIGGVCSWNEVNTILNDTRLEDEVVINSSEQYIREYNNPIEVVPLGFPKLDRLLNGGIIKGTITTIGARPSVGKTTFAVNIASHNPDLKILFFSLEMSTRMIYDKLISDVVDIEYSAAGKHEVNIETVKTIMKLYSNLYIVDNISTIENIADIIRKFKPDLVFIDYVQIITSQREFIDNRQRVDYISQILKRTAKDLKTNIIILSQLTRGAADKPTMSALKESGGLEQDSDYIILLHRPYVNNKSSAEVLPSDTTVTLDKNKFGNTGELKYNFEGRRQRFTEVDEGVAHPIVNEIESGAAIDDLPF